MTKQTRHQPREKVCNNSHLNLTTMARLQGISGGMSGRTGSFTYRQSRGETIVSQYQPIVKNPNTQGQQDQRARFKLMSQLAAILSPGFGTMGVTKRPGKQRPTQRNAFMQLNMPTVQLDSSSDNVTAKIPLEQVKLTSSTRTLGEISNAGSAVTIRVTDVAITSVRFVTISYIENDITRPVVSAINNVTIQDGEAMLENVPSGRHTVLAYGLIPTESASRATLNNLHTPDTQDYFGAVNLNNLVTKGEIAETETKGINFQVQS